MKNPLCCLIRKEKERKGSLEQNGCTYWWYKISWLIWSSGQRFSRLSNTDFIISSVNNSQRVKLRALNSNVWVRKSAIFMQSPYRRVYISLALSLHKTIGQWSQTKFPAVEWWMRRVSGACSNKLTFRAMLLRTNDKSALCKQVLKNKKLCFNLQVSCSQSYDTEKNLYLRETT
jgi:hypothetical protein